MFWLAMVSIALLLLTLLFPQLERRDEDRPRTLTPPYVPRRQSEQPSMPAVTIVETPKTASLSRSVHNCLLVGEYTADSHLAAGMGRERAFADPVGG
jgi:hypothetical protein